MGVVGSAAVDINKQSVLNYRVKESRRPAEMFFFLFFFCFNSNNSTSHTKNTYFAYNVNVTYNLTYQQNLQY